MRTLYVLKTKSKQQNELIDKEKTLVFTRDRDGVGSESGVRKKVKVIKKYNLQFKKKVFGGC